MSDALNAAAEALKNRIGDNTIAGSVKINVGDEGALRVDENGVSIDDADADCTLTADLETFRGMMDGSTDPTSAFMSGQLTVDGDMGVAMQLSGALT